jgi:hypothetical protein
MTELNPVILTPISLFTEKRLSVTITMDNPKERTTISMTFIRLKKTSVQVNPGKKNTNMNPSIALMMGKRSRMGKANPKSSLIGVSQSMLCLPLYQYLSGTVDYLV